MMNIHDRFEAVTDEYLKFDRVENKLSTRPDIHAFILLNEIFPGTRDMVSASGHDNIWLDVDSEVCDKLTDNQILELARCGVMFDEDSDCLSMFT